MSIKTLAAQALFVLLVVYQTPAMAGEVQGNVLNCTTTLQTLDVTINNVISSATIPTSSSGTGRSTKCSGRTAMQIFYGGALPADISANFHYEYQNPDMTYSSSSVVCSGRLEAGATSVDINLLNYSTCSFGRPRPAKG